MGDGALRCALLGDLQPHAGRSSRGVASSQRSHGLVVGELEDRELARDAGTVRHARVRSARRTDGSRYSRPPPDPGARHAKPHPSTT